MADTLITDRQSNTASYKILRRLGKGGMAEVFLARQDGIAGFRRLTVIKKLLPQFHEVSDVAEMLLDEARIAAQLTHPNIVQIYELGRDQGQYFIAMEYVDGCDLATLARIERRRESRVPLRLTLRVVSEAAMGLDYAHRQTGLDGRPLNIVHRDVSPHNIMCSREGAVKVTDFGIAKAVGKALVTQVGVIKGKVQYMAPEQYTGGGVDHRSDIFSLGVILYQLTTGRLPRVAKDGGTSMRRVIEGRIPAPTELRPDYPEELEAIVMRALSQMPDDRYPDAASLREDLLDFARGNDLLAFPKELGEYVNSMVPALPASGAHSVHESGPAPGPSISAMKRAADALAATNGPVSAQRRLRIDDGALDDHDTDPPPGTEVASPAARKRGTSVIERPAAPTTRAGELHDRSELAALPGETLTPFEEDRASALSVRRATENPRTGSGHTSRLMRVSTRTEALPAKAPTVGVTEPEVISAASVPAASIPERPTRAEPSDASSSRPQRRSSDPFARRKRLLALGIGGAVVVLGGVLLTLLLTRPPAEPDRPWRERSEPQAPREPRVAEPTVAGAGTIKIMSNPSRASVAIDGANRCSATPCEIPNLPLDRVLLVTVGADQHLKWMQRVVLTQSDPKLLLRADLTPLSRAPKSDDDSSAGAEKGNKGKSGAGKGATAAKGSGSPRKQGGGGGKGKALRPKIVSTKSPDGKTVLVVDARPWVMVHINGQQVRATPLMVEVPPGRLKVTLTNPELGFQGTYPVTVRKGMKVKVLMAIPAPQQGPPGGAPPQGPPGGGEAPPQGAPPPG